MDRSDLIVVGGGIVGLATAWQFSRRLPGLRAVVLEKEAGVARHQTGRNSGVLHSGIYYQPGSLKAKQCLEGKRALEAFCESEGLPFEVCGKVIVAIDQSQCSALDEIERRGGANGVACERIGADRLKEFEPHAAGVDALHVPSTGIVDFEAVCRRLSECIRQAGGEVVTSARALAIKSEPGRAVVETTAGEFAGKQVVNCAGLHSDRVARLAGARPPAQIVPFRGEYFELVEGARHLVRNLIYPVPDPRYPFLGVHFTRMIDGGVECGPNAVLAFAREGYHKSSINLRDLAGALSYPGFLRLAVRHWRMGMEELWRSFSKRAFVHALQRLVPEIRAEHLTPAPAGVRAQAVKRDGELVDDFLIESTERVVNVLNAPSPAATAALSIGETVVDEVAARFE